MSLCLQTTKGTGNRVSAYAPTLGAYPDVKDSFYEALEDTVRPMKIVEPLFVLGDFNARVGYKRIHWLRALRYHWIGMYMDRGC